MKILHITPHLGGGMGKALAVINAALRIKDILNCSEAKETFLLLEQPIKQRYANQLRANGSEVIVAAGLEHVAYLAAEADVVQFEFINHPRILECLARTDWPEMRSIFWAHISGLTKPYIPAGLIEEADKFIFTSRISYQAPTLTETLSNKVSVINSGFGFSQNLQHVHVDKKKPIIAYLGTVNFVKMHKGFFKAIDMLPVDVEAHIWGEYDASVPEFAAQMQNPNRFIFHGETEQPAKALAGADIFFYPLQRSHYGTGENALVEAMSLGIVPVVLNNPAEMEIVTNWKTGFVATTIEEAIKVLRYLIRFQLLRERLAKGAMSFVETTRTPRQSALDFAAVWQTMLDKPPHKHNFEKAIGGTPAEWFMSTQNLPGATPSYAEDHQGETKGSLAHFKKVFAGDASFVQLG